MENDPVTGAALRFPRQQSRQLAETPWARESTWAKDILAGVLFCIFIIVLLYTLN